MTSEQSLRRGLQAIKNKDYEVAIAILETYLEQPDASSQQLVKAQIGLVKAYGKKKKWPQAIALCEELQQSNNPKVRIWADQTQRQLSLAKEHFGQSTSPISELSPSELLLQTDTLLRV